MRLTISRKLFLSFLFVAAVPTGGFAILSQRVTRQLKEQITETFIANTQKALQERGHKLEKAMDDFFEDAKDSIVSTLGHCQSTDCFADELARLRADHPLMAHAVVRDRTGATLYSDAAPTDEVPPWLALSHMEPSADFVLLQPHFGGADVAPKGGAAFLENVHTVPLGAAVELEGSPAWVSMAMTPSDNSPSGRWLSVQMNVPALAPSVARSGDIEVLTLYGNSLPEAGPLPGAIKLPENGTRSIVTGSNGRPYLVYTAASWDNPYNYHFNSMGQAFQICAVAPTDELFAPAERFHRQTLYALAGFLALALLAASLLSRRVLAAINRLKCGRESIGHGEQLELSKLSNDELGGELVDSVNQMGVRLAERGRREEIENWGRVIRVLSHEINNTMAPVRSVAAMLNEQLQLRAAPADAGVDLRQASSLIEDRITALGKFVARFGELAKLPAPERHRVDLTGLAVAAARMFTEDARRGGTVFIVRVLNPAVEVLADVDPGQIERVLINLIKNALEASSNGGDITISVGQAGGAVHLEVEDRGSGITAEARKICSSPRSPPSRAAPASGWPSCARLPSPIRAGWWPGLHGRGRALSRRAAAFGGS